MSTAQPRLLLLQLTALTCCCCCFTMLLLLKQPAAAALLLCQAFPAAACSPPARWAPKPLFEVPAFCATGMVAMVTLSAADSRCRCVSGFACNESHMLLLRRCADTGVYCLLPTAALSSFVAANPCVTRWHASRLAVETRLPGAARFSSYCGLLKELTRQVHPYCPDGAQAHVRRCTG